MQSFPLNTYHTEILFSEQDWVVSFDQMIRLSYEMHSANVYLESRPQRLEMDQLTASAPQPTGLGDKFDQNDSASLIISSLIASSKTGNWYEESLLSSSVYELQYDKDTISLAKIFCYVKYYKFILKLFIKNFLIWVSLRF